MPDLLCAIPIKPFGEGKGRLAAALSAASRVELARASAERVLSACRTARVDVAVVTGSAEVSRWAVGVDAEIIPEPESGGLDGAATAAALTAGRRGVPYAVVHADLPLLSGEDILAVADGIERAGAVLAPSRDGGTSVLAARAPLPFRYGPGSFRRHLAAAAPLRPLVLIRPGLCIDLDNPADVAGAARLPGGAWIGRLLGGTATVPG